MAKQKIEEKEDDRRIQDEYYKKETEKFNLLKRKKKERSFEEKYNDLKIATALLNCYEEKMTEEMKEYIIDFQKEYFTKNPKHAYCPQNWIIAWEKKHGRQMSLIGSNLARVIMSSVSAYNF